MNTIKHLIYVLTCLLFTTIIGAAIYEHACIWPHAWAAPPASLSMFQGSYGMNNQSFWPVIHPPTLLLFIISTALFWKSSRRKFLLIASAGYIVALLWTFAYFVPELFAIMGTEYANTIDESLVARATKWETLSFFRLGILLVASYFLLTGLTKPTIEPGIPYNSPN